MFSAAAGRSLVAPDASTPRAAPSEATFNYVRSEDGGDSFASLRQLDDIDEGLNTVSVDPTDPDSIHVSWTEGPRSSSPSKTVRTCPSVTGRCAPW